MSWLSNLSLPKIRDLVRKTDTPENLWDKCPQCEQMVFHRDLEAAMHVCPHCGFHMRIDPKARLEQPLRQRRIHPHRASRSRS